MKKDGLDEEQALNRIYLTNSQGLLTDKTANLKPFQQKFVKKSSVWTLVSGKIDLLTVVHEVKPSIIIGVSGQPGLMSQAVIETLYSHCANPIVLPLSNPTSLVEALPGDVINWTQGKAMVATGSPFDAVEFAGQSYPIAQCNHSYIFPDVGLGVIASDAKRVTDKMFLAASKALADCSPLAKGEGKDLLPELGEIRKVSLKIAFSVAKQAIDDGVAAKVTPDQLSNSIKANFWHPQYRQYRRTTL